MITEYKIPEINLDRLANPTEQSFATHLKQQAKECGSERCEYLCEQAIRDGTRYICGSPGHPKPRLPNMDEIDHREINITLYLPICMGFRDNRKCYYLPEAERE